MLLTELYGTGRSYSVDMPWHKCSLLQICKIYIIFITMESTCINSKHLAWLCSNKLLHVPLSVSNVNFTYSTQQVSMITLPWTHSNFYLPPCPTHTRGLLCKVFELFSSFGKIPNISWPFSSRWSNLKIRKKIKRRFSNVTTPLLQQLLWALSWYNNDMEKTEKRISTY